MHRTAPCPTKTTSRVLSVGLVLYFGSLLHAIVTNWRNLEALEAFTRDAAPGAVFTPSSTSLTGALSVATGIVLLFFVARLARTTHELGAHNLEFTPSRAVWGYIIPIVSFVRPYRAMREAWQVFEPTSTESNWHETKGYGLVKLWWAMSMLALAIAFGVGFAIGFSLEEVPTHETIKGALQAGIASNILSVASSITLIALVKAISARAQAKWDIRFGPGSVPTAKVTS